MNPREQWEAFETRYTPHILNYIEYCCLGGIPFRTSQCAQVVGINGHSVNRHAARWLVARRDALLSRPVDDHAAYLRWCNEYLALAGQWRCKPEGTVLAQRYRKLTIEDEYRESGLVYLRVLVNRIPGTNRDLLNQSIADWEAGTGLKVVRTRLGSKKVGDCGTRVEQAIRSLQGRVGLEIRCG
ncbi:hypothetical protein ACUHMQ_15470 [Chitinimonas sp. PSY-7]|uniref:hypothetical protein n=1 Tax=Chitinimonas sp. PSY-7 TaxID=3459088 RepID=UPI004040327B